MNFCLINSNKDYFILLFIIIFVFIKSCNPLNTSDIEGYSPIYGASDNYIGSDACISCHKKIYTDYKKTAHYNTSKFLDSTNLKPGYLSKGQVFYGDSLWVHIDQKSDGIYQTAITHGKVAATHRIDMVIGSGRKGQTFFTWNDSSLYQLPLSYSVDYEKWINSPGYPSDKVIFNRSITSKCFECHTSYTEHSLNNENKVVFDKNRMALTISCETCHGPASKHVQYYNENPLGKDNSLIINASKMTRNQSIDACAVCHSGNMKNKKSPFSFRTGDKLKDFFELSKDVTDIDSLDVHANQYGLLKASECFKKSEVIDCNSCHNVHQVESNKTEIFAKRCMNCHNETKINFCTAKGIETKQLIKNCINCHMPKKASNQITFVTNKEGVKEVLNDSVRTHLIKVYIEKYNEYKNN